MRTVIDEQVQVWTNEAGTPLRMVWRGRRYLVTDKPTPWVDRHPWWTPENYTPRHTKRTDGRHSIAEQRIDLVKWRFQATPVDEGESIVVDVAQHSETGFWSLTESFS